MNLTFMEYLCEMTASFKVLLRGRGWRKSSSHQDLFECYWLLLEGINLAGSFESVLFGIKCWFMLYAWKDLLFNKQALMSFHPQYLVNTCLNWNTHIYIYISPHQSPNTAAVVLRFFSIALLHCDLYKYIIFR